MKIKLKDLGDSMKFSLTLTIPKLSCSHGGGTWSPADLSVAAYAWYDAQTLSTITQSGGAVSQWNDRSGNARHVSEGTADFKPDYTASAINGHPALTFDGGDHLRKTGFGLTGADIAAFIVAQYTTGISSGNRLVSLIKSGQQDWDNAGSAAILEYQGSPDALVSEANSDTRGTALHLAVDTPGILAAIDDGTSWQHWKDGTSTAATTYTPAFDVETFELGNAFSSWLGDVGEVIILDYAPTTLERQKIEGYLAHRWGLSANLPALHPYKSSAP